MDLKQRAVRHQTSEWIRITLRVDPKNKNYLKSLCDDLGISQNLLINKIIDCFREIDLKQSTMENKTIGDICKHMIMSSLKRDSDKYSKNPIDIKLEKLKEGSFE